MNLLLMVNGKKMKPKMIIPIWNLLSVSVFSVSKDHPFHHLFVNNVSCDISGISLFLNNLSLMCNNFHQADLLLTACSVAYYVGCHFPSFVNSDQCCVGWYGFWKNYYPAMSLFSQGRTKYLDSWLPVLQFPVRWPCWLFLVGESGRCFLKSPPSVVRSSVT